MKYSYVPESGPASDAWDPFYITREPFPEPRSTSRVPLRDRIQAPMPVLKLAGFAREHSWEVRTQYSRGCMPHVTTGRPGALKELIGLRFGAHPMTDRQAYAVYSRPAMAGAVWTWSSVMIWGPDLPPFSGCGIIELKAYLMMCAETDGVPMNRWVRDLKSIAENAAKLRADKPKPAAKPREGMS